MTKKKIMAEQRQNKTKEHLVAFFCALIYAGVLASLPLEAFKDRANYLVYAEYSWDILQRYWSQGFLTTIFNEPFWLLLNSAFSTFLMPDILLRLIIIFFPAFVVAYYVLLHRPKDFIWLLIFLFSPLVLKNHIVHLRQGVAIAIFLIGWFGKEKWKRVITLLIASLVHSSFFFVTILWFASRLMLRLRLGPDLRGIFFVGMGVGIGSVLGTVATFLGARQAWQYQFSIADVSGLGFIFWVCIFFIMILEGRAFARRHAFEIGAVVFYLGTYFFVEVTARIFESAIIPVLVSGLALSGWRRQLFLLMVSIFVFLQYITRWGQPLFGFGTI